MPLEIDVQGGTQTVPPIPKMEGGTPAAPTAAEFRQQAQELASQAKQAARDAAQQAKTGLAFAVWKTP